MESPLVSVVIPVYNAETFLKQAVDSILNQKFVDFEVIVVNDGSTDQSLSILNTYNDQRLKIISNNHNKGLVYSLNLGVSVSRGKYIARMDADDISHKERLERQVNFLVKNPDIKLIGCHVNLIEDHNKVFDKWIYPVTVEHAKEAIKKSCCFAHPAVIFEKAIFEEFGGYREVYFTGEDYDLWYRMLKKYNGVNLDETLLDYRVNKNGISSKNLAKQLMVCQAINHDITLDHEVSPAILISKGIEPQKLSSFLESGYLFWVEVYRRMGNLIVCENLLKDLKFWLRQINARDKPNLEKYLVRYYVKNKRIKQSMVALFNFTFFKWLHK